MYHEQTPVRDRKKVKIGREDWDKKGGKWYEVRLSEPADSHGVRHMKNKATKNKDRDAKYGNQWLRGLLDGGTGERQVPRDRTEGSLVLQSLQSVLMHNKARGRVENLLGPTP